MDGNLEAAGRQVGVTEKDIQTLQRMRLIKVALYGAIPVVTFFAGYFLRNVLRQETSSAIDLPASTYPYAAAAALIRVPSTRDLNQVTKKYTAVGVLSFAVVAFIVGYFIPDMIPDEGEMSTRYGVYSR